jgi:prefoldin subunit 5
LKRSYEELELHKKQEAKIFQDNISKLQEEIRRLNKNKGELDKRNEDIRLGNEIRGN